VPGDLALVDELKAAKIETAEHLGLGKGAVFAFGEGEIPALQNGEFGHHAAKEEIAEIERRAEDGGEFLMESFTPLGDGLAVADENASILQQFVDFDEIEVEAAEVIDAVEIDEELTGVRGFVLNVEIGFGIEHQGLGAAEATELQIVVDKSKQLFLFVQVTLPEGHQDALFRSALGIGRRVAAVVEGGNAFRLLEKVGRALRLLQGLGPGNQRRGGEIAVLLVESESVEQPHEEKEFQAHAAQHRSQDNHPGIVELVEYVHGAKDDGRGKEVALHYLFHHFGAVGDFLEQVFATQDAADDPDQDESAQGTPPDKIRQDAPCAITDLGHEKEGEDDYQDVQQQEQILG